MNSAQVQSGASIIHSSPHHYQTSESDRASLYITNTTPKHAMNAPAFVPSGQPFRQPNGVQQPYQSLSMTTMNAFAGESGPNTAQASGGAFTSGPCAILIRRLPINTTEEMLKAMA